MRICDLQPGDILYDHVDGYNQLMLVLSNVTGDPWVVALDESISRTKEGITRGKMFYLVSELRVTDGAEATLEDSAFELISNR